MRTLIFANGDSPSAELVEQVHRNGDLVFAADGGARHALACGLIPDAVIGDLDSIDDAIIAAIPGDRFHRVPRLDITDLEKTVAFALARGSTSVEILGASGGRSDHALANLSVLVTHKGAAAIRVHDELFEVSLVDDSTTIEGQPGTVVSLIALGECTGVTTEGLRWPLTDFTLPFGPRGIHNEIESSPARISVKTGNLLLYKGRWIEKHA